MSNDQQPLAVLVLDRVPAMQRLMDGTLRQAEPHLRQKFFASGGEEAFVILANEKPDLIIVNTGVRGQDNVDFLRKAVRSPGLAKTPLLVITGQSELGPAPSIVRPNLDEMLPTSQVYIPAVLHAAIVKCLLNKSALIPGAQADSVAGRPKPARKKGVDEPRQE